MSLITVKDIAYVRFTAPDLAQMRSFLEDFGLAVTEDRGRVLASSAFGTSFLHRTDVGEPGFAGLGLAAHSLGDLRCLARAEGTTVEAIDAIGGGYVTVLTDPDGHRIEVVAERDEVSRASVPASEPWITASTLPRVARVKRTPSGASHVVRLGHCVLNVANFRVSERWYKERFGFLTSDEIAINEQFSLGAFLRCDRGDHPTDHHTLFLLQSPRGPGFNHAAFEVVDMDDLMAGHTKLLSAGRKLEWGVGRHILGSQVFDYWRDPWGHTLEHWTDGDRLTAASGSKIASLQELIGVQWGPPAPPTMA